MANQKALTASKPARPFIQIRDIRHGILSGTRGIELKPRAVEEEGPVVVPITRVELNGLEIFARTVSVEWSLERTLI